MYLNSSRGSPSPSLGQLAFEDGGRVGGGGALKDRREVTVQPSVTTIP